jgi:hypothetical protein
MAIISSHNLGGNRRIIALIGNPQLSFEELIQIIRS